MITRSEGAVLVGLKPLSVQVSAIPNKHGEIKIFGMSEVAAREATIRLRAAGVTGSWGVGIEGLPEHCPAAALDLAIYRAIRGDAQEGTVYLGSLDMQGQLLSGRGILIHAEHWPELVLPSDDAWEAGLADRSKRQHGSLTHIAHVDATPAPATKTSIEPTPPSTSCLTLRQEDWLKALAGETRALIIAPPGAGKTLIAREVAHRMGGISREALRVRSAAGLVGSDYDKPPPWWATSPLRAPHHTVSTAGLVGGGAWPRPGEVSLAHDGVLFLDELPEFRFEALEMLAAVLKAGSWNGFPAAPRLVLAAANPCPCGHLGSFFRMCDCSDKQVASHHARIQKMADLLELTEVRS